MNIKDVQTAALPGKVRKAPSLLIVATSQKLICRNLALVQLCCNLPTIHADLCCFFR